MTGSTDMKLRLARELKCPSCGIILKEHSGTQLRKCKLILDIATMDKNRKVMVPIE